MYIIGKRILDFGCGDGFQSIALSQRGAASVVGIDSNSNKLDNAHKLLSDYNNNSNVEFINHVDESLKGNIDIFIPLSLNFFIAGCNSFKKSSRKSLASA